MSTKKSDILARLQKEILPLQGYKSHTSIQSNDIGWGPIRFAFPNAVFPLGAIHEFICDDSESLAASGGFVAGIISSCFRKHGPILWISTSRKIFPPALTLFGIDPDKIIFIDLKKEKDLLWTIEEALKCHGLAAVIGEIRELDFTSSRRLQLAVEQSRVTGFILRKHPSKLTTNACVTRWRIESVPSSFDSDIPGVGFPRWNVELLKVRNGKPGSWEIEWKRKKFKPVLNTASISQHQHRKTG